MRGRSDLPRLPRFSTETVPAAFRCKASASIYSVRAFHSPDTASGLKPLRRSQTCGPYLHLLASAFQSLLAPPLSQVTPQDTPIRKLLSKRWIDCRLQLRRFGVPRPRSPDGRQTAEPASIGLPGLETTVRGKMAGYLGSVYSIGCCLPHSPRPTRGDGSQ